MLTASFRRKTILFLLLAVLATPWASAAGPRTENAGPAHAGELSTLEVLDHLWSFLRSAWSKSNCHIDPDGLCSTGTAQPPPQTKTGCHLDPNGLCPTGTVQPPPQAKEGCHLDPNGLCVR